MIVLVDLDETLCDLMGAWFRAHRFATGQVVRREDVTGWSFFGSSGPTKREMRRYLENRRMFRELAPLPGAIGAVRRIHRAGHDVVVVTAPSGPESAAGKVEWCRNHLRFLPRDSLVVTGRKELVRGDWLVDDRSSTLSAWLAANPDGRAACIAQPWNADCDPRVLRAQSWRDTASAWLEIEAAIRSPRPAA